MLPSGATAPAKAYQPRCADEELVCRVVAAELDGFLADAEARGHPTPSFVASTFREFLTRGVPEHGFIRVHCDGCGHDRVVAFSCKRRGVCDSCGGRRMAETAAHLVDCVLPAVPTRQWVLSLPFPLRCRVAYDRTLATPMLAAFLRAVFASLRRRAREIYGVRNAKCGAVTFLQRFGIDSYVGTVERFARFFGRSPAELDREHIRTIQVHLVCDRHLSTATLNVYTSALRFLYTITSAKDRNVSAIPCTRTAKKLPEVLHQDEVLRLFAGITNIKHRARGQENKRSVRTTGARPYPSNQRRIAVFPLTWARPADPTTLVGLELFDVLELLDRLRDFRRIEGNAPANQEVVGCRLALRSREPDSCDLIASALDSELVPLVAFSRGVSAESIEPRKRRDDGRRHAQLTLSSVK